MSGTTTASSDHLVREEPLEIRVGAVAVAVLMRTPGDDLNLVLGFLISEGVIQSRAQLKSIRHCSIVPSPDQEDNVIQVVLEAEVDLSRLQRNFYASSSCGVCGKASIEQLMLQIAPIVGTRAVHVETLVQLPILLRASQPLFARTGGLHAAGLFDSEGCLLVVKEDIGRHNAVDKALGWACNAKRNVTDCVLLVSGRISFEIIQKAGMAGVPLVAGISAPSSLAVELARSLNMTLVAFLRDRKASVYSCPERLQGLSRQ